MDKKKKKSTYRLYIPWFTTDTDFYDEEESSQDGWIKYIRRNLKHPAGEESPFPESSWSYTRSDSPFEGDQDEQQNKKSDSTIHDDVTTSLYRNPDLDASHIGTIVLNGIVILFGTVETLLEKNEAQRVVEGLQGVWKVRNEIKIDLVEGAKGRNLSGIPTI